MAANEASAHEGKLKCYCFSAEMRFRKWNTNILHRSISIASLSCRLRVLNASYIQLKCACFLNCAGCIITRLQAFVLLTGHSCLVDQTVRVFVVCGTLRDVCFTTVQKMFTTVSDVIIAASGVDIIKALIW
jgi:hypothetical protein